MLSNFFKLTIGFKNPWSLVFFLLFVAGDSQSCLNGGSCIDDANGKYTCACVIGWKGDQYKSKKYWLQLKAAKYDIQKPSTCRITLFRCRFWVDVSRFSPCVINLPRKKKKKNICCGLKKCSALIG